MSVEVRLKEIEKELLLIKNNNYDTEMNHKEADYLLCEALSLLGQLKIVERFEEINKWYA